MRFPVENHQKTTFKKIQKVRSPQVPSEELPTSTTEELNAHVLPFRRLDHLTAAGNCSSGQSSFGTTKMAAELSCIALEVVALHLMLMNVRYIQYLHIYIFFYQAVKPHQLYSICYSSCGLSSCNLLRS